jgi:hypothetical protein
MRRRSWLAACDKLVDKLVDNYEARACAGTSLPSDHGPEENKGV